MQWFPEVDLANPTAIKTFVGNKIDLRGSVEGLEGIEGAGKSGAVSKEAARKVFEEEMNCKYYECSALTRTGVVELFEGSVREALGKRGKSQLEERGSREKNTDVCCQLI